MSDDRNMKTAIARESDTYGILRLRGVKEIEHKGNEVQITFPVRRVTSEEIAMIEDLFPNTSAQAFKLLDMENLLKLIV